MSNVNSIIFVFECPVQIREVYEIFREFNSNDVRIKIESPFEFYLTQWDNKNVVDFYIRVFFSDEHFYLRMWALYNDNEKIEWLILESDDHTSIKYFSDNNDQPLYKLFKSIFQLFNLNVHSIYSSVPDICSGILIVDKYYKELGARGIEAMGYQKVE